MKMFRTFTPQEEADARKWARENYQPLSEIKGVWHPVVQDECVKINLEKADGEAQALFETLPEDMKQALKKGSEEA